MTNRFTDHLLTGDHPSRPSASAVPTGTLYSCTTHSLIYKTDGTTWSTWATLGSGGGGGGITGQSVARGVLARSYAWATDVQSWTGTGSPGLTWSSAGWIQLSGSGNASALEPGGPTDGVVDYKFLWRPHMAGQGGGAPVAFDFHLTAGLGDYTGWRILLDQPNTNIVLQRRFNDLGVITTVSLVTVKMKWANDPVMDFLVRYQTLNGVDVIKVFVDGAMVITHESSEFTSGLTRFFLNNTVCRIGSFAAYT